MTIDAAHALLKPVFTRYITLSDDEWARIKAPWTYHTFARNEYVLHAGETERYFYFILEGIHRSYFMDVDGNEVCVAFAYAPGISGVPDSFLTQTPSFYTLQALSDGSMLAISYTDWQILFDAVPTLNRWAHLLFTDILVGRLKRERELMAFTAEERYQRLVRESPHMFQLVPQKHLASYVGMTPETFSRMRRRTLNDTAA